MYCGLRAWGHFMRKVSSFILYLLFSEHKIFHSRSKVKFSTDIKGFKCIRNEEMSSSSFLMSCDEKWCESIEKCIDSGDKQGITELLNTFHLFNKHGDFPNEIFGVSCVVTNKKIVTYLLENGYDVNVKCKEGWLPIEHAIFGIPGRSNIEVVKLLLQKGARCDKSFTDRPLVSAVLIKDVDMVKLFLEHGCDANLPSNYVIETIPLKQAIHSYVEGRYKHQNLEIVKHLIDAGADINYVDEKGNTYLHLTVKSQEFEMTKILLEAGASVNMLNNNGRDPLSYALRVWKRQLSCNINKLGDADEFIDGQSSEQVDKAIKCMELLLEYGADVNNKDLPAIYNVLSLHERIVHSKIVNFLLINGANFNFSEHLVRARIEGPVICSAIPDLLVKYSVLFCTQDSNKQLPFECNNLRKKLLNYYAQCKDELELVKETLIGGRMPLFDVLSDEKIGCYARNESICDSFRDRCTLKRFPIYGDLLIERFAKEEKRQNLLKSATEGLASLFGCNASSFPNIFDGILKHLTKKDLITLQSSL